MLRLYFASGRRRSLRYEVRALNLPQDRKTCGRLGVQVRDGCGLTHGSAPTVYLCSGYRKSARSPTQFEGEPIKKLLGTGS